MKSTNNLADRSFILGGYERPEQSPVNISDGTFEKRRVPELTKEEILQQSISLAYGNLRLENQEIARQVVDEKHANHAPIA